MLVKHGAAPVMSGKHIQRRGDSWHYQFTVRGERHRGSIGAVSKSAAMEVAEKTRIAILEGKLLDRPARTPWFGKYDSAKNQFTHSAAQYLAYYKKHNKPKSHQRMVTALIVLCPFFGDKRLEDIHPFLIERYKAERKQQGRADATVNRELACLKNLFNLAIEWGLTLTNPMHKVALYPENNARERTITPAEEQALLSHCKDPLADFILTAIDTGFRPAEIMGLHWHDVDFARSTITARSAYTKTGKPRTNPMTARLHAALSARKQRGGTGAVFGPYNYREPFEAARKAAGLGTDVLMYTMRHTYISRLIMAGVDLRTAQELAGHKTIAMTMRYAHLAGSHKSKAIEKLESELTTKITTFPPQQDQTRATSPT